MSPCSSILVGRGPSKSLSSVRTDIFEDKPGNENNLKT